MISIICPAITFYKNKKELKLAAKIGDKVMYLGSEYVVSDSFNNGEYFSIKGRLEGGMPISTTIATDILNTLPILFNQADATKSESPKLGERKNSNKLRWRNVPMFLFEDVIKVGQFGESKYSTFNYLKGMSINTSLDCLKRHLTQFESPYEADDDAESMQNHLAHVAWNAIVALHMLKTRPELDDRYKGEPEVLERLKGKS